MVKIRTLLVEGRFPIDYGWRRGLSEKIQTMEDKGREKRTSTEDVHAPSNRNEVQFIRSRRWGRGALPRGSRTSMSNFNCYYCNRTGHGWRECPERICNNCGKKGHDPTDTQCPLSYKGTAVQLHEMYAG